MMVIERRSETRPLDAIVEAWRDVPPSSTNTEEEMPEPPESSSVPMKATPAPAHRLVLKVKRKMSFSTALFYLQGKAEIDEEYRRILEAMFDALIRHTGIGALDMGEVETAPDVAE